MSLESVSKPLNYRLSLDSVQFFLPNTAKRKTLAAALTREGRGSSTAQDVECEDCLQLFLSLHSKKSDVEHILIGDYKANNSYRISQDLL